jgi:transposase
MKFSPTLAIEVSKRICTGESTLRNVCETFKLDPKDVVVWHNLYRVYGESVFYEEQDFDSATVQLAVLDHLSGLSLTKTCVKYKILHISTLRNWKRSYSKPKPFSMSRRKTKSKEEPEESIDSKKSKEEPEESIDSKKYKELQERLMYLEAENAFLKKLRALMMDKK